MRHRRPAGIQADGGISRLYALGVGRSLYGQTAEIPCRRVLFFDYDKQKAVPIQAIQVWSVGPNKTDDDGVNFDLPGDAQRTAYSRRDDIRILLPLKQSKP